MQQSSDNRERQSAILLLGPTGAGKTPLGEAMQRRGFQGRRCFHFDFGANLRVAADEASSPPQGGVASGVSPDPAEGRPTGRPERPAPRGVGVASSSLSEADRQFVREVLQSGALLERETFYIGRNVLLGFMREHELRSSDVVVLNGLPRHVGQAEDVDAFMNIQHVVFLECSAATVRERIRLNSGGDRGDRSDDSLEQISEKLRRFDLRTLPLLDHYRQKGVSIMPVHVTEVMTAQEMLRQIDRED